LATILSSAGLNPVNFKTKARGRVAPGGEKVGFGLLDVTQTSRSGMRFQRIFRSHAPPTNHEAKLFAGAARWTTRSGLPQRPGHFHFWACHVPLRN
jgi:hypothetical protein